MGKKRKCCVSGCCNSNENATLFTFPRVPLDIVYENWKENKSFERLLMWIKLSGNKELLNVKPLYFSNHYFICCNHFGLDSFAGTKGKKLQKNAYPEKCLPHSLSEDDIDVYIQKFSSLVCLKETSNCVKNGSKIFKFTSNTRPNADTVEQTFMSTTGPEIEMDVESIQFFGCLEEDKIYSLSKPDVDVGHHNDSNVQFEQLADLENEFSTGIIIGKCVENVQESSCKKQKMHIQDLIEQTVTSSDYQTASSDLLDCSISDQDTQKRKSPFIKRKCSALNCENNNLSSSLYSFPSIYSCVNGIKYIDDWKSQRCRLWVQRSGNRKLLNVNPSYLQHHYFLCNDHFEFSQFSEKAKTLLKRNALPNIFVCESLSENEMELYNLQWNIPECLPNSNDINITTCTEEKVVGSESGLLGGETVLEVNKNSQQNPDIATIGDLQVEMNNSGEVCKDEDLEDSEFSKNSTGIDGRVRRKCCVIGCSNKKKSRCFAFPKILALRETKRIVNEQNLYRCFEWLKTTGNPDLLKVSPLNLWKTAWICVHHFSDDQFCDKTKRQLKRNAKPGFGDIQLSESVFHLYENHFSYIEGCSYEEFEEQCNEVECALKFEDEMKNLKWFTCDVCNEKQLKTKKGKKKCLHGKQCSDFSVTNNMDPGSVPVELSGLSFIEEQLIARVHPLVSVFKLKGGGQFGYSGNVISFPQNVQELATHLPHKIKDISSIVKVRLTTNAENCHDFQVRAHKVYTALVWLIDNNPFYKDICISHANLETLPGDANVFKEISEIVGNDDNLDLDEQNETEECSSKVHYSGIPTSCIPHPDEQIESTLNWPTLGSEPINEFKTPGYIACAFPTLFPNGAADLNDSRMKKMNPSHYFKHLLRYHDNRFARHVTFRFFALNSLMRWAALTNGNIFVQNNAEFKNMTVGKLKKLLKENPSTIKKIMYRASNLRGTKPYWRSRCFELKKMVQQLGLPTIFLTLSFPDYHCKHLYQLLTDSDVDFLSEQQRRKLLQDNPMIVDTFFKLRIETFINEVVKKKYKIKDLWYRIEYQHRGSPHLHGLFWFEDAPDVLQMNNSEEMQIKVKNYFDKLVTAINPDQSVNIADTHPCRKSYGDVMHKGEDLAQLVNTVQKHTRCSTAYCLKYDKKEHKFKCRFGFPISIAECSKFERNRNGFLEYIPERNDVYLNKFCKYMMQVWRGNMDIAPVVSEEALIAYLVKYVGKAETSSAAMDEVLNAILQDVNDSNHVRTVIQRLFIRVCAERDFSAQEVCHILMGHKLFSSGRRNFVHVNLSTKNDWVSLIDDADSDELQQQRKTVIDKYKSRPDSMEHISLWEASTLYDMNKWKKLNCERIVLLYPTIVKKEFDCENEEYYRQEVLLHYPWRCEEKILGSDQSWKDIFIQLQKCDNNVLNLDISKINHNIEVDSASDESDAENGEEEWMLLSRIRPNAEIPKIELGRRQIDLEHDWNQAENLYRQYGTVREIKDFIPNMKKKDAEVDLVAANFPDISWNEEQSKIISIFHQQMEVIQNNIGRENVLKRTVIQGKAGTGKSLLIKYIISQVSQQLGRSAVLVLAPTGVSALSIDGQTAHSALHLPINVKSFRPLTGEKQREFCNQMEGVRFLIVDEYSMVGCSLLAMIEQRCKEGTGNFDEVFGGLYVFFFGDICQLPPVKDSPVYSTTMKSHIRIYGKQVLQQFQKAVILKSSERQKSQHFECILDRLSKGKSNIADFVVFQERFTTSVTVTENNSFKDAIRLFPKRIDVEEYNLKVLETLIDARTNLPKPVARISAQNNCKQSAQASTNEADGLDAVIYLAQGCTVMLRSNVWLKQGLVNGSLGTVVDILYENDQSSPNGVPLVVLCNFPSYKGPKFIGNTNIVPIYPVSRSWISASGENCTRIQFPLQLSYACSIHKSQGLTLDKVVVDLGSTEFCLGLAYVAFSRVKTIEGLLIYPFCFDRISSLSSFESMKSRIKFEEYLMKLDLTDSKDGEEEIRH